MELCPPLHLGAVAIEKGTFRSPLTMIANFHLLYLLYLFDINVYISLFLTHYYFLLFQGEENLSNIRVSFKPFLYQKFIVLNKNKKAKNVFKWINVRITINPFNIIFQTFGDYIIKI